MRLPGILAGAGLASVIAVGLTEAPAAAAGLQPGDREPVALRVEILDGISGGPVRGVTVRFTAGCGSRRDEERILEPEGNAFRLGDTGFERGERAIHGLALALPDGWIREPEAGDPVPPLVTRLTRTLLRTVIVWPEAPVQVQVLHADGRPAGGASLQAERLGERVEERWMAISHHRHHRRFRTIGGGMTGEDGRGRLRGIPAVPGARYSVQAEKDGRTASTEEFAIRTGEESHSLTVRLPAEAEGRSGGMDVRSFLA